MDTIIVYLKNSELLENKIEARILRVKEARYMIYYDKLYRRGYSMPLLKCMTHSEANYIMREIHEGMCENHAGRQSLAFNAPR